MDEAKRSALFAHFRQLPGVVVAVAPGGRVLFANDAFYRLPEAAQAGAPPAPEPVAQITLLAACERAMASGTAQPFDMADVAPKPARWYHGVATPVVGENGQVTLVMANCTDITEAKQEEERIRRSEALLVDAQNIAQMGIWEWELATDTVRWTPELFRIYHLTPQEYTPSYEGYLGLIHPDDRDRVVAEMRRAVHEKSPFSHDERILRPDGSIGHLHTWGRPIIGPDGQLQRLIGVCQDITERKRLEEHVQQADVFRSVIFDTVGDVLFYIEVSATGDYRFLTVNDAFLRVTGLARERVDGRLVQEVIPEPSVFLVLEHYARAIRERRTVTWDEVTRYPSGVRHGEVSITPLFDADGTCRCLIGSVHDITERVIAEAEARRTLTILDSIVEGTSDAVFVKDADGRYVLINSAGARLAGRPPADFLGKTDSELFPPEAVREIAAHDQRVLDTRQTLSFEETRTFNGASFNFLTAKGPVRDTAGKVWGLFGIARDISALKRTQANLEHALSFSHATLEATADGILVIDMNEHITGHNERFRELWRLPQGFVETRGYRDTLRFVLEQLDHPEACVKRLQEVMADPESESTDLLTFRDGRVFERYSRPQRLDGKIVGRVFSYRDITARTRAEEALKEREARQMALAEASRRLAEARLDMDAVLAETAKWVGDFFQDGSMVRLFTGDTAELRTVAVHHPDAEAAAMMRRYFRDSQTPIDDAATRQIWQTGKPVLVSGSPEEARKRIRPEFQPVFDRFPVHSWMIVPLRVAGRVTGAITAARFRNAPAYTNDDQAFLQELADRAALTIDNARLYQEARQAIQLREEFLSIASHELKTPLTPLKMKLQLLNRALGRDAGEGGGKERQLADIVADTDDQVDKITRLVDDMLDIARIQSGSLSLKREETDLGGLAEEVVARWRPQLRGAKIHLTAESATRGRWDRFRLEQVLSNLLSNALRYGQGTDLFVRVARDGGNAVLSVQDFGIGIAKEDQVRIFDRFERALPVRHFGGLGLGLFIARQIVNAHGGTIEVASEPGHGSVFTVKLPLES